MSKVNAAISPKISIKSSMIALAVALSSTTAFAEESASSAEDQRAIGTPFVG